MKTRDSGMPDQAWWESFFDPEAILDHLGLDRIAGPVIDVGCGYGTFILALARRTAQPVIGLDIEPELVELTRIRAAAAGLHQVEIRATDATAGSLGVEDGTADVVLLFNILHCEAPLDLLAAARRALRRGGRVAAIHWRRDVPTPRGPDLHIRPTPEAMVGWICAAGFAIERGPVLLPPYHTGLVGIVTGASAA